ASGCGDPPRPKTRMGSVQQKLVGANVEVSVAPGSPNEQAQIDAIQNEQAIVRTMAMQPGQSDPVPALVAAYAAPTAVFLATTSPLPTWTRRASRGSSTRCGRIRAGAVSHKDFKLPSTRRRWEHG